jgi:hypothetical protein
MVYPTDFRENLLFRARIDDECRKDYKFAQVVKELCAKDVLFFVNVFLNAEDPFAEKGLRHGIGSVRIRPIITYPCQDEFILDLKDAIDKGDDILADKSRDMLATYMVLAVFIHGWIFNGRKFMISSWKEDEIDGKEDTSTHFGKLRLFLKYLPYYLLPKGFNMGKNSSYMNLRNPENGGTIVGSAASQNLASGRREDAIFMDELSKWEKWAKEAWISASDATRCKAGVWTPRGSANFAYELMHGEEVTRKHHLLWWKHPEKTYTSDEHLKIVRDGVIYDKVGKYKVILHEDQSKAPAGCYVDQNGKIRSEWYDESCKKRTADDIAENLDCNYLTTGNPIFDTQICMKNKYASVSPEHIGELHWVISPTFDETGFIRNFDQLEVDFSSNMNGWLKVWDKPENDWDNAYCISADVAEGLENGDFDSASVLKRIGEVPKVVATIHGKMRTFEYAERLAMLGVWYKKAFIAPERNNTMGGAVLEQLFKYYNLIYHKDVFLKGYATRTDKLGWETTGGTKGQIIGNLSKSISEGTFNDPDEFFWAECLTYVNDNGKLGGSNGTHDDKVMDRAILLWINTQLPLPTPKRRVVKHTGWRSSWNKENNKGLIRFVV